MLALVRTELSKQLRRPRTWVALGACALIPIIVAVALKASPPTAQEHGENPFFLLSVNTGLLVPGAALRVMSRLFLIVVVALFAGDAVAGEASSGNLRAVLVRPVGRGRLLAAKLCTAVTLSIAATVTVAVAGLAAGVVAFGFHPLDVLGFHRSEGQLLLALAGGVGYVAWSLMGIIVFAFMISTMTDSSAGATLAAVGLYLTSQILDAISALGSVRNYLPTHKLDAWDGLILGRSVGSDMWQGVLLQVPYIVLGIAFAWWWFRRKDILS